MPIQATGTTLTLLDTAENSTYNSVQVRLSDADTQPRKLC
jgi:hypothetical protein